ncbi:MAG: alcohol dehydrogenase catalytic domain-containing protein [Nitrospirae bacterium]|nr:alcohol dehydrogenase catalytic domain-containing protein [Nitrospirota bacterium]
MKVARLYSFTDIRIEDMPIPVVGPREALVKTRACGICSGDVMPWYIEKKAPLVLGHEPSGEIVEIGREVTSFRRGDRVFIHHHAPCLTCRHCRRGDYVQCLTWKRSRIMPGGIAEYILVPETNLGHDTIELPENMSFEEGALIEPAACVVKGLKRAHIKQGDTILVIGLGVMGMMQLSMARTFGAGRIVGADRVKYRIDRAPEFGADDVIDVSSAGLIEGLRDLTAGEMAELVIVGPNSVEVMLQGVQAVRPGGQVLFFTPAKPDEMLTLDPNYLYFNDINIITSYSCGPNDTADACALISKGIVPAGRIITHRFPIQETAEAFRLTAEAGDSLKSLVVFD